MRVLYLIFVLCVGALLWTAIAAARHIRRHEHNKLSPPSAFSGERPDEEKTLVTARKSDGRQ